MLGRRFYFNYPEVKEMVWALMEDYLGITAQEIKWIMIEELDIDEHLTFRVSLFDEWIEKAYNQHK